MDKGDLQFTDWSGKPIFLVDWPKKRQIFEWYKLLLLKKEKAFQELFKQRLDCICEREHENRKTIFVVLKNFLVDLKLGIVIKASLFILIFWKSIIGYGACNMY